MATLTAWTQALQAALPGITPAQVEEKLRHAIKEFFLQSRSWRRVLGPLDVTQAGLGIIALDPVDADTRVVWVRSVWFQEGNVQTPLYEASTKITEPRVEKPRAYFLTPPSTLNLWPTPGVDYLASLYADCVLTVTDTATVFPDLAVSHHFEAILNGAYARLHAMPNKPWTDPMAAGRYAQLFRRACIEARNVADSGYTHSDPPWRFPPFA